MIDRKHEYVERFIRMWEHSTGCRYPRTVHAAVPIKVEPSVFAPADLLAGDVVTWRPCRTFDTPPERTDTVEVVPFEQDANGHVAYLVGDPWQTMCCRCVVLRVVRDGYEVFPSRPVESLPTVQRERDRYRRERDVVARKLTELRAQLAELVK